MDIRELLIAPATPGTGQALLEWARNLRCRVLAGEMMIGLLTADDVNLAPQALRRAVACGVAAASLDLAGWFANPPVGEYDLDAAIATLREAIAGRVDGAPMRLVELQWFYRREEADDAERAEAFKIACGHCAEVPSDAHALHMLGLLTCQGFGVARDPTEAARLQERAGAMDDASALFEAFLHHETGLGVPKDSAKALGFLERAATLDHPRATYNLGAFHATGRGVPKDLTKAAALYERSANAGNPRAIATLAVMYAKGEGVPKDTERAIALFDEAEYVGMDVSAMRASVQP